MNFTKSRDGKLRATMKIEVRMGLSDLVEMLAWMRERHEKLPKSRHALVKAFKNLKTFGDDRVDFDCDECPEPNSYHIAFRIALTAFPELECDREATWGMVFQK